MKGREPNSGLEIEKVFTLEVIYTPPETENLDQYYINEVLLEDEEQLPQFDLSKDEDKYLYLLANETESSIMTVSCFDEEVIGDDNESIYRLPPPLEQF